jgi:hypothetical protein
MENPFEITKGNDRKKEYKQIILPVELINKLKAINKGSMRQTIEYLLGNNADERLISAVKDQGKEITKLQEKLVDLARINHWKTY